VTLSDVADDVRVTPGVVARSCVERALRRSRGRPLLRKLWRRISGRNKHSRSTNDRVTRWLSLDIITTRIRYATDMAMGWVDPWVGLGWVEFGQICWLKLPGASSAFQQALLSRRETYQRSAVPFKLIQGCRPKLLKQWNSFVGQCVVHCLTWTTNDLI